MFSQNQLGQQTKPTMYIYCTKEGTQSQKQTIQTWFSCQLAMSVLHKIFIKDFKLLKFCFFLLTSFFLYGEFRLFFVEKPSLTSDGRATLAPINFPEILICKIDGYDKGRVNHFFLGKSSDSEFLRPPSPFLESSEFFKGWHMVKGPNK